MPTKYEQALALMREALLEEMWETWKGVASKPLAEPPPNNGKRLMRSQGEVDKIADRMLTHIRANPGQSMGEIRKAMGLSAADAQFPMRKLREGRKVRITGKRASARYYAKK